MPTPLLRARLIAPLALLSFAAVAEEPAGAGPRAKGLRHFTVQSKVDELLRHPAFAGFAPLLLPWDNRDPAPGLTFGGIATLLPYHTEVRPQGVVAALNHMVDAVGRGETLHHAIYDAATRQRQPDKAHTGLFHFRGRPGAPFAIVAPGGGFSYVGSVHEGFPYAQEIAQAGYHAFVLKYRVGQGGGAPNEDMAAAISYVMRNAERLGAGRQHYALWGSSAGARMAASIGSHGTARFGGDALPKPSAVVMAYTAHMDQADAEPATFIVVGENDGIAPPAVMRRRADALRRAGTRVEFREYPAVAHGFGPGTGTSADGWIGDAIRFWQTEMR
jgi:acetyl esterase/lipase